MRLNDQLEMCRRILKEEGIGKTTLNERHFHGVVRLWCEEHEWDMRDPKRIHCLRGKCAELRFTEESLGWDLPFHFVMNWGTPFDFDMLMVSGPNKVLPIEHKTQRVTKHIPRNDQLIAYDNWLTLKRNQLDGYIREGLELIVIDRHLDHTHPTVKSAKEFAKNNNWTGREIDLEPERSIHFLDIETIGISLKNGKGFVQDEVPANKRGNHNGRGWTGETTIWNADHFPAYPVRPKQNDEWPFE